MRRRGARHVTSSRKGKQRGAVARRDTRVRRNRLLVLAILALLALATVAPTGQASGGAEMRAAERTEHQSQRAEHSAQRAAERSAEKQRREAARQDKRALAKSELEAKQLVTLSNEHAEVEIGCTRIVVTYKNFNVVPGSPNEVAERLLFKAQPRPLPSHSFERVVRSFEGAGSTFETPIAAPQGRSVVTLRVKYNTNGLKGSFKAHLTVECGPIPAFQVEELQSFGAPFTAEPLAGKVGETVAYETVVTNVGNTPLTFSNFIDAGCEGLAGGALNAIEPFSTTAYYCTHTLTAADATAGSYPNAATVTGTPEEGEGAPATHGSNTVVVTPIAPGEESKDEGKKEEPGTTPTTTTTTTPPPAAKQQVLSSGASSTSTTKTGVLGFSSATIPTLRGPQGCVRSGFTVSVKSAGIGSVVFYLDGHKIKRLTSANARKGLLSVHIDGSKLKVGAHRVRASITMKANSSTAKAARATRSFAVVRCRSTAITPHFTG